jgi:hypothetical protein
MFIIPFDSKQVGAVDVNIPSPIGLTFVISALLETTHPYESVTATE